MNEDGAVELVDEEPAYCGAPGGVAVGLVILGVVLLVLLLF